MKTKEENCEYVQKVRLDMLRKLLKRRLWLKMAPHPVHPDSNALPADALITRVNTAVRTVWATTKVTIPSPCKFPSTDLVTRFILKIERRTTASKLKIVITR